jgi:hypothetical protein
LKLATGALEAFLGIPILGGAFIIATGYTPLWVMLVLHLITLYISHKERAGTLGSVIGIVTCCIGWIPFVGMVMHWLSAIALLLGGLLQGRGGYYR